MEKTPRVKHSDTLGRMQFGVSNLNKRTRDGGVALKKMKVRRVDMKVLIEGVVTQMHVQQADVHGLKKLLEETHSALEGMKERVSQLTDDVVATSTHHFEEARRRISLPYPHLDLSPLDPFKVVIDKELVDEEWFLLFFHF